MAPFAMRGPSPEAWVTSCEVVLFFGFFFFACLWGFFDHKHVGSLVPRPEIKPLPPASGARTLNRRTKQGSPRSRGEIEHSKFKGCLLPWIFISWTCPSGQPPPGKAQSLPKMREKEVIVAFLPHLLALKLGFFSIRACWL